MKWVPKSPKRFQFSSLHTSSGNRTVTVLAASVFSAKVREINPGPVVFRMKYSDEKRGGNPRIMGSTQFVSF